MGVIVLLMGCLCAAWLEHYVRKSRPIRRFEPGDTVRRKGQWDVGPPKKRQNG